MREWRRLPRHLLTLDLDKKEATVRGESDKVIDTKACTPEPDNRGPAGDMEPRSYPHYYQWVWASEVNGRKRWTGDVRCSTCGHVKSLLPESVGHENDMGEPHVNQPRTIAA